MISSDTMLCANVVIVRVRCGFEMILCSGSEMRVSRFFGSFLRGSGSVVISW